MKKTLFFFLIILFSYIFSRFFLAHQGYVLFAWKNYTLESSLWSFLFSLAILAIIVKIIIMLCSVVFSSISLFYPITRKAKSKKAQIQATKGMIHYINGRWYSAQRLLAHAGDAGQAPLITYLTAARAAHQNGDNTACLKYLRKANKKAPSAELAIGITRAELLLAQEQKEQALAILKRLYKKSPNHEQVLKLLKQSYQELKDWQSLRELLPKLCKYKVINDNEYQTLHKTIYQSLFDQAYQTGKNQAEISARIKPINNIWKSLNHRHQKNTCLIKDYAHILISLGAEKEAESFIRKQLFQNYCHTLLKLYGNLEKVNQQKLLLTTENLLIHHPNDPELLLCLGKICCRSNLQGKAEQYFLKCLNIKPAAEPYYHMGNLLAKSGDFAQSSDFFQKGVQLQQSSYFGRLSTPHE